MWLILQLCTDHLSLNLFSLQRGGSGDDDGCGDDDDDHHHHHHPTAFIRLFRDRCQQYNLASIVYLIIALDIYTVWKHYTK